MKQAAISWQTVVFIAGTFNLLRDNISIASVHSMNKSVFFFGIQTQIFEYFEL